MKQLLTPCAALCATLLVLLGFPTETYAWGPGVHLAIGQTVLENLHFFPALLAENLLRHSNAFLYGCLSADIFIGKGTRFKPGHSHNWDTGMSLLESAHEPRTKSYAYGYLSHLAADVIAHNFYVPNMVWNMPYGGNASHVYVEMQADLKVDWSPQTALKLFRKKNRPQEGLLLSTMAQRRWTFLIKKRLMMGSLNLCTRKTWDNSLHIAGRIQPWADSATYLTEMLDLSTRAALDVLLSPEKSIARDFDPIGSKHLSYVRGLRAKKLYKNRKTALLFHPPHSLEKLPRRHNPISYYAKAQAS